MILLVRLILEQKCSLGKPFQEENCYYHECLNTLVMWFTSSIDCFTSVLGKAKSDCQLWGQRARQGGEEGNLPVRA